MLGAFVSRFCSLALHDFDNWCTASIELLLLAKIGRRAKMIIGVSWWAALDLCPYGTPYSFFLKFYIENFIQLFIDQLNIFTKCMVKNFMTLNESIYYEY